VVAYAVKAVGYFREEAPLPGRNGHRSPPGDTLSEQSRAFFEFCKREGMDVAATFPDAADSPDQPNFQDLLAYLKRQRDGNKVVVVVAGIDRLGRDPIQAARNYFQIDKLGSRVVLLSGEAVPEQSLVELWARRPRSDGGLKVREAMRKKAVRGEALGRPPYGYRVGSKGRLEPVPEERDVVRHIFRLYTRDGLGIRLIAKRLNEEGYLTRRGGNWSMVTIRDILLNRAYLGTYTRFGVRVPGSHEAIISAEEYRRVQDRMASRRTGGGERHLRQFLLSGLAICQYCGNKMIGVSRRQTWQRRKDGTQGEAEYRYYQCLSRTNQSLCDYHTRRAADLEDEVRQKAAAQLEQSLAGAGPLDHTEASVTDAVARLRARVRQLDRQLEQYMDAAAHRQLSLERLRELSLDVTERQMETDDAITQLEGRRRLVESLNEQRRERDAALQQLRDGWEAIDFERRQALIRDIVEKVVVGDDSCEVRLRG
jgi:DNA invertase Pin-like site-specific DNA recombinase